MAEAPPGARNPPHPAAHPQVVQVELEDIVPLDHIGVERGQPLIEGEEEPPLGRVGHLLEEEQRVGASLAHPDRKHPVVRPRGIAEAAVSRARLDVDLAAP